MRAKVFTSAIAGLLMLAWAGVCLSADMVSQVRQVEAFDKVKFSGRGSLYIAQGEKCSLRLEAEQSDLEKVQVSVENGELEIKHKKPWLSWSDLGKVNAYVTMAEVKEIQASGSVRVVGKSLITAPKLDLKGSGATRINLTLKVRELDTKLSGAGEAILGGSAARHEFKGSGSADLKAFDLITQDTSLKISGAGKALVFVNKWIDIKISGSAEVRIKGPGKVKTQKVSGSAEIKWVR